MLRSLRIIAAGMLLALLAACATPDGFEIRSMHGNNPQAFVTPALGSGYTESQMYRPLGINAYGFVPIEITPEIDETQHAANERIPVVQLRRGVKIYYELVARAANQ